MDIMLSLRTDCELKAVCFDWRGSMKGSPTMLLARVNKRQEIAFLILSSFVVCMFIGVLMNSCLCKSLLRWLVIPLASLPGLVIMRGTDIVYYLPENEDAGADEDTYEHDELRHCHCHRGVDGAEYDLSDKLGWSSAERQGCSWRKIRS